MNLSVWVIQDLTLVHNASNSIINQAGIGDLLIQKAGSTKLTVNSTGIDVTGNVILESSDAGAGEGPEIFLHRNSASPAASDVLGVINFDGENSAGSQHTYGKIKGVIVDPTNTSEDGKLVFQARGAGAGFSDIMTVASTGIDVTGSISADGLTVQTTNGLNALLESTTR